MNRKPNNELRELFSAYLDGELDPEDRILVDDYVAADGTARAELDELRTIRRSIRSIKPVPAPRSFAVSAAVAKSRVRWAWARPLSAVAAAVLGILVITDVAVVNPGLGAGGDAAFESAAAPALQFARRDAGDPQPAGALEAAPLAPVAGGESAPSAADAPVSSAAQAAEPADNGAAERRPPPGETKTLPTAPPAPKIVDESREFPIAVALRIAQGLSLIALLAGIAALVIGRMNRRT